MIYKDDIPESKTFSFPYPKNPAKRMDEITTSNGILIEIEGLDGSGKSTLVKELVQQLGQDGTVVSTNFIHSEYINHALLKTKWENADIYTFLYMYLSGLAFTYSSFIIPHLREGHTVILDRYTYTIALKALVGGVSAKYLTNILSVFRPADFRFFLDTDVEVCLDRKLNNQLTYWECGGNILADSDPDYMRYDYDLNQRKKGFITYQTLVKEMFDRYIRDDSWNILDGRLPLEKITKNVKTLISPGRSE